MTKTTAINPELVDQLLADYQQPEDLLGENGILKQLTKALVERALAAELTDHLGHAHGEPVRNETGNKRNGSSQKTIQGEFGELEISIPRDREGSFEPLIVPKRQARFKGFETKIVSLYARGMSTREIQAHLQELYGVEVSPTLISNVTEAVVDEIKLWQNRALEPLYPILFLDCLHLKIRGDGTIKTKAVYVAIGVNLEGQKDVLGLWIAENEGSKFWLSVLTELRNRGVQDVFIACVDGLKGFPEAIEAAFPKTQVQLCIVHLVRYSLNFVSWKERKAVATDLKTIYQAPTEQAAARCSRGNGTSATRQSARPGGATGLESFRASLTLERSGRPSTRRTRSSRSTSRCGRSRRLEAHSRVTRRQSSCCFSDCEASPSGGRCRCTTGRLR